MNSDASRPIRVMLVDDQELVRTGFEFILNSAPDINVVAHTGTGHDALRVLEDGTTVDVACVDIRMPGLDGIATTQTIVNAGYATRVLILTTFDEEETVYRALEAGASGFLLKDCGGDELMNAVRRVHQGNAILAPSATTRLIERFLPLMHHSEASTCRDRVEAVLSARELEVLTAIAQGLTNREIAGALHMAESTVKHHVGQLLSKLNARDRVQLVITAYDAGIAQAQR